jgi:Spy/CpxP family protein refolding chaperone
MKPQKTTLMLLLCVLAVQLFAQFAIAQEPPSPEKQEAMAKLEKMSAELQLTPQQKKQMLPIMMEEAQKMKAIKTNTSLGGMQKMMQMKQVGTDMDAKVQPILNPQQYQKFQQIRQQEREEMIQKMRSGQSM